MRIPHALRAQIEALKVAESNPRTLRAKVRVLLSQCPANDNGDDLNNRGNPHSSGRQWRLDREFGDREYVDVPADERLAIGAEIQAGREAVLAYARFRSPRDRALYQLHVEGFTRQVIADSFGVDRRVVRRVINRYERQWYADQSKRLDLDAATARIWRRWCRGRNRRTDLPTAQNVVRQIRGLPAESISVLAGACDRSFVAKVLTPEGVPAVDYRDPEVAELLQKIAR